MRKKFSAKICRLRGILPARAVPPHPFRLVGPVSGSSRQSPFECQTRDWVILGPFDICENRRLFRLTPLERSVERRAQIAILVSLGQFFDHRSGWFLETSESRYRNIPSPRRSPPTPRNRTKAMGRVQNKHKASTSSPRISKSPENCSRRSIGLALSITGHPSRTSHC